jgi:enoyl-CoA hydratase
MDDDVLLVRRDGHVATLTLNRPSVLNALNAYVLERLATELAVIDADPEIRAVVLTGAGERAFAAGADIGELNALAGPVEAERKIRYGQGITMTIERLRVPVIAAVNGFALGGGCELAMACDIRIASENAKFGQPEVNLGLIPGYGGTQRMARLAGTGASMLLCLSGETIDAAEAHRIGIVQRVVPLTELIATATLLATTIAEKAPLAVAATKRAIRDGAAVGIREGLALEASYFATIAGTADAREGTRAFLDKRKPVFEGR